MFSANPSLILRLTSCTVSGISSAVYRQRCIVNGVSSAVFLQQCPVSSLQTDVDCRLQTADSSSRSRHKVKLPLNPLYFPDVHFSRRKKFAVFILRVLRANLIHLLVESFYLNNYFRALDIRLYQCRAKRDKITVRSEVENRRSRN